MNRFMVSVQTGCLLCIAIAASTNVADGQVFRRSNGGSVAYAATSNYTSTPSSSDIVWHDDLQSGWQESKRSGRPMIIFITSDRCRYCDIMKQNTWHESSIRDRITGGFVAIRLKPGRNFELGRIPVHSYPTTLLAAPEGKVIAHEIGYHPPNSIHTMLSKSPKVAQIIR